MQKPLLFDVTTGTAVVTSHFSSSESKKKAPVVFLLLLCVSVGTAFALFSAEPRQYTTGGPLKQRLGAPPSPHSAIIRSVSRQHLKYNHIGPQSMNTKWRRKIFVANTYQNSHDQHHGPGNTHEHHHGPGNTHDQHHGPGNTHEHLHGPGNTHDQHHGPGNTHEHLHGPGNTHDQHHGPGNTHEHHHGSGSGSMSDGQHQGNSQNRRTYPVHNQPDVYGGAYPKGYHEEGIKEERLSPSQERGEMEEEQEEAPVKESSGNGFVYSSSYPPPPPPVQQSHAPLDSFGGPRTFAPPQEQQQQPQQTPFGSPSSFGNIEQQPESQSPVPPFLQQPPQPRPVQILSEDGKPPCIIKVVGIGGGGGNTVNRMIDFLGEENAEDAGVEFWSINTDVQALGKSLAKNRIQIGPEETRGLGAGSKPEVGRLAAEESAAVISAIMRDTDMVFVTAGMGGGTGSGAAPVVAQAAKLQGCLTVGVVTKPFHFEGKKRTRQAAEAIDELRNHVDILIVVSNDKLLEVAPSGMALQDAFAQADDILRQGIVGISEIITKPGLINVDFADVNSIMSNAGLALMGIGEGEGPTRAKDAAFAAINSPLLDFPLENAKGVVYTITGGPDMSLAEVNSVAEVIAEMVHPDANVIFGATTDENAGNKMRVVVVATNFENNPARRKKREIEAASKPHSFPAGSAGFIAFGPGSELGKGYSSGNYARDYAPQADPGQLTNENMGSEARYESEEQDRPPVDAEEKPKRRRGLGGWWYWWRN